MKPDYYMNSKEHVMTYKVWKTMGIRDVAKVVGIVFEDPKPQKPRSKGKKARKAAKAAE